MKRLIAISNMGKKRGLYITPIKVNENTYATGQTIIPGIESTIGGLTLKEATGEETMSKEKMQKFPFIINPYKTYRFENGKKFDPNNDEHNAYLGLIELFPGIVAKDKASINRKYHEFYIEDIEAESESKLSSFNKRIKAGNIVLNMTTTEKESFARFLKIYKKDVSFTQNLSSNMLMYKLSQYADEHPDLIIEFSKPKNKIWIKVTEFIARGILTTQKGSYYENGKYISKSIEGVIDTYNNDPETKYRWDKKLIELTENKGKVIYESGESNFITKSQKQSQILKDSILTMDFITARKAIEALEKINDEFAKNTLMKYSKSVSKIKEIFSKEVPENKNNNIDKEIKTIEDLYNNIDTIDWETLKVLFTKFTGLEKGSSSRDGYKKKIEQILKTKTASEK